MASLGPPNVFVDVRDAEFDSRIKMSTFKGKWPETERHATPAGRKPTVEGSTDLMAAPLPPEASEGDPLLPSYIPMTEQCP